MIVKAQTLIRCFGLLSESHSLPFQDSINYDHTSFTLETAAFKQNSNVSQEKLLDKPFNLIAALSLSLILQLLTLQIRFKNSVTLTIPKLHKPWSNILIYATLIFWRVKYFMSWNFWQSIVIPRFIWFAWTEWPVNRFENETSAWHFLCV